MSIVTKTGDDGSTGLYGAPRVQKDAPRIQAYGDADELNSLLGLIIATHAKGVLRERCLRVQKLLFRFGADLATPRTSEAPVPRMETTHIDELEAWIKETEPTLPPQHAFILPGGSHLSALLHVARTVCRRAERACVTLGRQEDIGKECGRFLNRLSDWLFIAARQASLADNQPETTVSYD